MGGAAPSNLTGRGVPTSPFRRSTGLLSLALLALGAVAVYVWRARAKDAVRLETARQRLDAPPVDAATARVCSRAEIAPAPATDRPGRSAPPNRSRARGSSIVASGALIALLTVPAATATETVRAQLAKPTIWAVDVSPSQAVQLSRATLLSWRADGINSVVLETKVIGRATASTIASTARRAGLTVIALDGSTGACRVAVAGSLCATTATSPLQAVRLARRHTQASVVAVHLLEPSSIRFLRAASSTGALVLAIPPLNSPSSFPERSWQQATVITASTPSLGLAVLPPPALSPGALAKFFTILSGAKTAPAWLTAHAAHGSTTTAATTTTSHTLPAATITSTHTTGTGSFHPASATLPHTTTTTSGGSSGNTTSSATTTLAARTTTSPTSTSSSSGSGTGATGTVASGTCNAGKYMSRNVKAVFATAALCAAGAGAAAVVTTQTTSPASQATTTTATSTDVSNGVAAANVWVSTKGNDRTCGRNANAAPDPGGATDCATFNGASSIAQPGDVIGVACGTYPNQDITTAPGVAPAITFASASPRCAVVGTGSAASVLGNGLFVDASYVTIDGFKVNGSLQNGNPTTCTNGVTLDHDSIVNSTSNRFYSQGASNFYYAANSIGPMDDSPGNGDQNWIYGCSKTTAASGTFSGNTIHDVMDSSPGAHVNGLYLDGGTNGVTIAGNRFENIAQSDLALDLDTGSNSNITVTNNFFDAPCSHPGAVYAGDDSQCGAIAAVRITTCGNGSYTSSNVVIRNNTLNGFFR